LLTFGGIEVESGGPAAAPAFDRVVVAEISAWTSIRG